MLGLLPVLAVLAGVVIAIVVLPAAGAAIAVVGLVVLVANHAIGSPARLVGRLATYPADDEREARLVNLVNGLCAAGGLPVPELRLIDDVAPNAIILGRDAERAALVCTTGLLDLLDRMELEAVVAHELAHVKRGDLRVAARATAALGLAAVLVPGSGEVVMRAAGREREALADLAGVRLTRYPPGLVAALEKIGAAPTVRPAGIGSSVARLTACLWFAPLVEGAPPEGTAGVLDLQLRAAALHEL